jgi:hypothetical protein
MGRPLTLPFILSILVICGLACGQGATTSVPKTKAGKTAEPGKLTEPAKSPEARYEEAVAAAKTQYEEKLAAARAALIADLDKALADATKAGNLDEALRIREAKKSLESEETTKPPPALREGAVRFGKSQFRIVLADVRWSEAREACRKLGGDLAGIDSEEKREFLKSQIGSLQLWVGGHYNSRNKRWQWPNGKSIASDAWSPGRPENNGPYTVIFPGSGLIGDGKEDLTDCKGYICEWTR